MIHEIILRYLGQRNGIKNVWNHPNYTTFIHTKGTPLHDKSKRTKTVKSEEYKVLLIGDSGVGKESLATRFVSDQFPDRKPYEDLYLTKCKLNVPKNDYDEFEWEEHTDSVSFNIVCCEGREMMSDQMNKHVRWAQILILVFSVVDKETFEEIEWLGKVIPFLREREKYSMIVVGNKCDLRMIDENVNDQSVNMNGVYEWCLQRQIPYIETSAKNGKNVNLMFRHSVWEHISNNPIHNLQ